MSTGVDNEEQARAPHPALFGAVIFLGAFLLFSLEPLVAKKILPWFGGSAAVWSTCLVFYQLTLLTGYLYARVLTRYAPPSRIQPLIHTVLLFFSVALLPIGPSDHWKPDAAQNPSWLILGMLAASIGLPFALLSATSPLLQHWLARGGHKVPYRLFSLSNFASLAALLSYPVLIEPLLDIHMQVIGWSAMYVAFVILCAWVAWQDRAAADHIQESAADATPTSLAQKGYWFALSACGSMLLLSITNHITKNVAPVPFLWVLPLAIYLLTFILAFRGERTYKTTAWRRWLVLALLGLGFAAHRIEFSEIVLLPVFLIGLFVCCYFCHGELVRLRPAARDLTVFYLFLSLGGATGAVFVGLLAPYLFGGIYELPLSLILIASLALLLSWRQSAWASRVLSVGLAFLMILVFRSNVDDYQRNTVQLTRNFYGSLRVVQPPESNGPQHRILFHGTIEHGVQFLSPVLRSHPTSYYGTESGIGIVLQNCFQGPKRVGLVGLGVGTLATYGKSGDVFRFYELNPQIIEAARTQFTFLRDSRANVSVVEGDARLSLEREHDLPFDVLVLDAFSGDAVPTHLLTKEAFALYRKHLKPEGALVFHLTNRYLNLPPVVSELAKEIGYHAVLVRNRKIQYDLVLASSWVLVTNNRNLLENPAILAQAQAIPTLPGLRSWTDNYNSLFPVLKMEQ